MAMSAGEEIQVNTYTAGAQKNQRILMLADGGWVVIWNSDGQDGDSLGVYQQRYKADGTAVGAETRVNSHTTNSQSLTDTGSGQFNSQTIALSNGGWVVAWTSWDQDGEYAGVYQQAYRADGTRIGSERQVNIATDLGQQDPVLAPLANGGWVTYWISQEADGTPTGTHRLYHRTFDANGTPTSGEVRIAPIHESDIGEAQLRVAALDGGGWVATWINTYRSNPHVDHDVYYEAFNASGTRIGSGRVNVATENNQTGNAVAGLEGGGWVIVWKDGSNLLQRVYNAGQAGAVQTVASTGSYEADVTALEGGGWVVTWQTSVQAPGLHMRAYDASGNSLGASTAVMSGTGTQPFFQTVALKGGGWVTAWSHKGTGTDIAAQVYKADGSKDGGAIFLNSTRAGDQYRVRLAALEDGGFVATWTSDGQDGSGAGVFQRVFRGDGAQNTPPTAKDDSASVREYAAVTGNVITDKPGKDSDPDGDALNVVKIDGGSVGKALKGKLGTLTLNKDGSYSYTANRAEPLAVGETAKDTFTYTVSDGKGGTDTAKLVVTVTGVATGTSGKNHLLGTKKAETLKGLGGDDILDGRAGNDTLDGGAGADRMLGGKGNDTYVVDSKGDKVIEKKGEGTDLVKASISFTLPDHVEKLALTGSKAIDGTGNGLANTITGNSGNNRLKGAGGGDTLVGGKGNDTLDGGAGNDRLIGGAGADTLIGGAGKDMFIFTSVKDSTDAASGRDTIRDFSRKDGDKVDLKAIDANTAKAGDQAFTFIGTEKFHKKAGELRYEKKDGDTFLRGDVNGDGKADFAVRFDGSIDLTKADFIL